MYRAYIGVEERNMYRYMTAEVHNCYRAYLAVGVRTHV